MKRSPVGYKTVMYIDLKTNKLVGTETPVYIDPKTGISHLCVTRKIK